MEEKARERIHRKCRTLNHEPKENIQHPTSNIEQPMVSNWAIDWRLGIGCWMFDVRCSQGFMGENSPKMSRIEPMNRRKTSNTQHPTSNNQWFPIGPLIGGWVLDVGCWMLDVRCSQGFRTGGQRHSLKFNVLSDVGVGLERAGLIITD